jgi:hypothetical protein
MPVFVFCAASAAALFAASGDEAASAAAQTSGTKAAPQSMDVTIVGEADQIPFAKDPLSMEMSLEEVLGVSKEGETEAVLAVPLIHLGQEDLADLLLQDSRQTFLGVPATVPSAPFVTMRMPSSPSAGTFEVRDQDNERVYVQEGTGAPPASLMAWDGMQDNRFRVLCGIVYTPLLILQGPDGKARRHYGDPVQFDAIQYREGDRLNIEFSNADFFTGKSADFTRVAVPLLNAALQLMREHQAASLQIAYSLPAGTPAAVSQKRLDALKTFFADQLVLDPASVQTESAPAGDRGNVTRLSFSASSGGRP